MIKRTVAIFAAYDASEKAFCAMYLAEHISLKRYRHAIWIVPEDVPPKSRYHGFSHKWDAEILSLKSESTEIKSRLNAKEGCELCLFFEESERLRSLLPETSKTALLLDPAKWQGVSSKDFAKRCNYTLSTSPAITRQLARPNLLSNTLSFPYDHFVQMMPKVWLPSGETATLLYAA